MEGVPVQRQSSKKSQEVAMTQNSQSADYPRAEIIFVCRVQCNNYVQYYGKIGGQIRVQNFLAGE
jgi:hypothetical protein